MGRKEDETKGRQKEKEKISSEIYTQEQSSQFKIRKNTHTQTNAQNAN